MPTREVICSLALALMLTAAACTQRMPAGPAEDGPPLPAPSAVASSSPATSSAETSSCCETETTAPAPPKDPAAELRRTARDAAVKAVKAASVPDIGTLNAGTTKLAKDAGGTWWASVVVMPSRKDVDGATVYLRFTAHGWTVVDLGTGIDPGTDDRFPADIRHKL